jgi:phosphohistidine phosphatase SixA
MSLRFRILRLSVPFLVCAALLLGPAPARQGPAPHVADRAAVPSAERGRILLVTRHCEKDPAGDARDPGLSAVGRERATALQRLLAPQHVGIALASEYHRAQETAALAIATQREGSKAAPRTVPAGEPERLFAAIDALEPGATALVVGHSNTVPAILAHYGVPLVDEHGKAVAMLPDAEYGALFVVTLPAAGSGAAVSLLQLHYGD